MLLTQAGSIAASGMRAQSTRLGVSAHNVANVTTDGFEGERAVVEDVREGGVRAHVEPGGGPSGAPAYDADEQARTLSNVDVGAETVQQISAQRALEANLAVFRTADEMQASLLDVRR